MDPIFQQQFYHCITLFKYVYVFSHSFKAITSDFMFEAKAKDDCWLQENI